MTIYHSIPPKAWPSTMKYHVIAAEYAPFSIFFTTNPIVLSVCKDGIHQFGSVFSFGTFSFDKQLGHMWGFRALQFHTNNIIMSTLAASANRLCGHIGSHSMTKRIFENRQYRTWEGHTNVQMEGFPDTSIVKQHMHLAIHCFRSPHELSLTKPRMHHSPFASGNLTRNPWKLSTCLPSTLCSGLKSLPHQQRLKDSHSYYSYGHHWSSLVMFHHVRSTRHIATV